MNSVEITRQALKAKPIGWALYAAIEYRDGVEDNELKEVAESAITDLMLLHRIEQMGELAQTAIN